MTRMTSSDLALSIQGVLLAASRGRDTGRGFLTAYQILRRLPQGVQARVGNDYGTDISRDSGSAVGPATRIAQEASGILGIEHRYLDTVGLELNVGAEDIEVGTSVCALFRLS